MLRIRRAVSLLSVSEPWPVTRRLVLGTSPRYTTSDPGNPLVGLRVLSLFHYLKKKISLQKRLDQGD